MSNWRDSNAGLGYGNTPFDVNTALVPAALRAIEGLSKSGVINSSYAATAARYAQVWETQSLRFFDVNLTTSSATSRLENFAQQTNLTNALASVNNTNSTASNLSFYAVSLDSDGTPVQVMNSDIGFNLLYGNNVSVATLEHAINVLQPYPRGLVSVLASSFRTV